MLNLTPHEIVVVEEDGSEIMSFPASGTIARVSVSEKVTGMTYLDGVPVEIIESTFGEVEGLPSLSDLEGHERFLVSSMVLDQLGSEWSGIAFAPDTGKTAVRNDKNHIIGVTRLRTVTKVTEGHKLYLTEANTFVKTFDCFESLQNYVAESVDKGTLCTYVYTNEKGEALNGAQWLAK